MRSSLRDFKISSQNDCRPYQAPNARVGALPPHLCGMSLLLLFCGAVQAQDAAYVDSAAGQAMGDPAYADRPATATSPQPQESSPSAVPLAESASIPSQTTALGYAQSPEAAYLQQQLLDQQAQSTQTAMSMQQQLPPQPSSDAPIQRQEPDYADIPDMNAPYGYTAAQLPYPNGSDRSEAAEPPTRNGSQSGIARAIVNGVASDVGQAIGARMQREILGDDYGVRILHAPPQPQDSTDSQGGHE